MAAAISARSGSGTVIERMSAVHIEVTGASPNNTPAGPGSGPITAATAASPTVVSSPAHGLVTGDIINISGSNTTPTIDGNRSVTVTGAGTFTIPVNVTVAGTAGTWSYVSSASGVPRSSEKRHYILVDAPVGVADAKSVVFSPSADGKFTWDDYVFPEDGAYTLRLRNAADDSDLATAAVTVTATPP